MFVSPRPPLRLPLLDTDTKPGLNGPGYAVRVHPSACSEKYAACFALPTQSSRWSHPSSGMKSSAIGRILFPLHGDRRPPPDPFERDPREDQDSPGDLEGMQRLREQDEREEDGEERLEVAEERRARRPDAVDRGEPEDVGEEERADHRVAEAEPDLPPESEVLRRHLRDAHQRERDPPDCEHERADPERRVTPHQGPDRYGVTAPREREPDREQVSAETAREVAAARRGDQPDTAERDRRAEPQRVRQVRQPEDDREQRDEHGR